MQSIFLSSSSNKETKQVRVFDPGTLLKTSLIIVGKAKATPLNESPKGANVYIFFLSVSNNKTIILTHCIIVQLHHCLKNHYSQFTVASCQCYSSRKTKQSRYLGGVFILPLSRHQSRQTFRALLILECDTSDTKPYGFLSHSSLPHLSQLQHLLTFLLKNFISVHLPLNLCFKNCAKFY